MSNNLFTLAQLARVGQGARRADLVDEPHLEYGDVSTCHGQRRITVLTGSILDKFSNRGFTFIAVDPENEIDENVFLHVRAIEDQNQANLFVKGSRVEFEVVYVSREGRDRPQARNARLVVEATSLSTLTSSVGERRGSVKFWHPMGYGFIADEKGDHEYYVKSASVPGGYLREGDALSSTSRPQIMARRRPST
jgi:cold shock CspA family protein